MADTRPTSHAAAGSREVLAILAADLAGYARLMEAGEEETHSRLSAVLTQLVRPCVATHRGRLVKLTGDGFIATFPDPEGAADCALRIQAALAERSAEERHEPLRFRMALHTASVIVEQDDVFGDGVVLAARLQALAEPGGLIVTAPAAPPLQRRGVKLVDLGEVSLKHLSRTAHVFAVAAPSLPSPTTLEPTEPPSLAVLPFGVPEGGAEDAWFAAGIIEGIVYVLSGLEALTVVAAGPVLAPPGADLRQVGRDLNVRYLLTGTAQRAGGRLRLATNLVDAATGAVVRADRFEGAAAEPFDLQDQIAAEVAAAIAPSVRERELARARRAPPDTATSYELLLRALDLLHRPERESFARARGLLQQAISSSPGWAPPRSYAGFWHLMRITQGWSADGLADLAEAAQLARAALSLDPRDAVALGIQALALCFAKRDHEAAAELAARALEASPNSAFAWGIASFIRSYRGDWQGGLEAGHRAMRLSPFAPFTNFFEHTVSLAHFVAGQLPEAAEWARRSDRRGPGFAMNLRVLVAALVALGQVEEARVLGRRLLQVDPGFTLSTFAARAPLGGPMLDRFIGLLRAAGLPE